MVKKGMNTFQNKDRTFYLINGLLLILFSIIVIYPIWHMFVVSISNGNAVLRGEVNVVPVDIDLSAYKAVLKNPDIPRAYLNTIYYTVFGTFICLTMTTFCAYPLSRKHFTGRKVFTVMIIFTMFFDAGMISNYMVVNNLKMINKVWALVLPGAINTWYMIIMRTYFQQIPNELYESAELDGANDLQIFWRIFLPLSKAILATMTLFYAVGIWNSWFSALIYMRDKSRYPVQLIMRNIVLSGETTAMSASASVSGDYGLIAVNIKYAVVFVTMIPILIVYPYVQKYFVKGVMIGALKG